jgi:hypothetical protein
MLNLSMTLVQVRSNFREAVLSGSQGGSQAASRVRRIRPDAARQNRPVSHTRRKRAALCASSDPDYLQYDELGPRTCSVGPRIAVTSIVQ